MAAVRAAAEAAEMSLNAVESSVQTYVEQRDYMRLKDMAEASAVAGQVPAPSSTAGGCRMHALPAANPPTAGGRPHACTSVCMRCPDRAW